MQNSIFTDVDLIKNWMEEAKKQTRFQIKKDIHQAATNFARYFNNAAPVGKTGRLSRGFIAVLNPNPGGGRVAQSAAGLKSYRGTKLAFNKAHDAYYGQWVEWGSKNQKAQYFVHEAIKKNAKREIQKILDNQVKVLPSEV